MMKEKTEYLRHFKEFEIPGIEEFVVARKFQEGKIIEGVPVAKIGPRFRENLLPLTEKNVHSIKGNLYRIRKESTTPIALYELGGIEQAKIQVAHFFMFLKHCTVFISSGRYIAYYGENLLLYADWDMLKGGWFIECFLKNHSLSPCSYLILSRTGK